MTLDPDAVEAVLTFKALRADTQLMSILGNAKYHVTFTFVEQFQLTSRSLSSQLSMLILSRFCMVLTSEVSSASLPPFEEQFHHLFYSMFENHEKL